MDDTAIIDTVIISKSDYEKLIRDSERIAVLDRFIGTEKYISTGDIFVILGIEREEKKDEHI